jgi:hypothetical protein
MITLTRVNLLNGEAKHFLVRGDAILTVTEHSFRPGELFWQTGSRLTIAPDGKEVIVTESVDRVLTKICNDTTPN